MNLFSALKSLPTFFELFKEGKEISNPETWKNRTIATNVVLALIATAVGLSKTFGYEVALDNETIQSLAVGAVAAVGAVNAVMHCITSKKVGLSPDNWNSNPKG